MPRRPREHQLEELSRRAFRAALPSSWVCRGLDPDYGLDETVEIFTGSGLALGLSFHAQLKATDQPDLGRALRSIRFSHEQGDYYRSLALPVLIVLFHAPTGRLFTRWFHAYNPHVAIRPDAPPPGKSFAFQFSDEDAWTSTTPAGLEAGVRAFNVFRSPSLPLPLRFMISHDRGVTESLYELLFSLRALLKPVNDLLVVEAGPRVIGDPFITVATSASRVSLAEAASVSIDHEESGPQNNSTHAADLGIAIATVLANVGQDNLAARVAAAAGAHSQAVKDFNVAFVLAGAFGRSRRAVAALQLSDALDRRCHEQGDEDARIVAFILRAAILSHGQLSDDELRVAIEVDEKSLTRARERGDAAAASATAYNLGMLHKQHRDREAAVRAFDLAAELDPSYLERPYFRSDLAGALFESGAYVEAAMHYGAAVAKGEDELDRALYADALLFSGRYAEAEAQLDRYLEGNPGPEGAEWRLKHRSLAVIRELIGDVQDRASEEAKAHVERVDFTGESDEVLSIDEALALIDKALAHDACDGEAWFRRSVLMLGLTEDAAMALEPTIVSAVLHRTAIGAWTNALRLAKHSGAPRELVADLLRVAYRFNDEEMVAEVSAMAGENGVMTDLLQMLDDVAMEMEAAERSSGFTMRIPNESGQMTEFVFRPEE